MGEREADRFVAGEGDLLAFFGEGDLALGEAPLPLGEGDLFVD